MPQVNLRVVFSILLYFYRCLQLHITLSSITVYTKPGSQGLAIERTVDTLFDPGIPVSVSVCSGYCHKIPLIGWLIKQEEFISHRSKAGKARIKAPAVVFFSVFMVKWVLGVNVDEGSSPIHKGFALIT